MTEGEALYQIYKPPLRIKIARMFGFRPARYPFDDAFDFEGKDAIYILMDVRFSFADRIRVLVSGKVSVASITRTSFIVGETQTRSNCTIPLWPER
ncbi:MULTISPECIES: hypothetical protein [unclassified Sphingomonas]|uniref:hypothetical protein n=1 Tax=unclassified Sphingomonas TaxID=196159 RepID=UPI0006FBB54D|nr:MULTISPECIES: hypothetical protein [unclassified Sphingomonas]KQX19369.1 hypothetical protein ASD17_12570 [Sphingomonas sp. Root1294]KQY65572.1 hypothetical protein ASD39_15770 [Sphingomonas sp. Root50]KRB95127.1 hypothetical protein ASE22_04285 [Sphingomonas sp. Root720]